MHAYASLISLMPTTRLHLAGVLHYLYVHHALNYFSLHATGNSDHGRTPGGTQAAGMA